MYGSRRPPGLDFPPGKLTVSTNEGREVVKSRHARRVCAVDISYSQANRVHEIFLFWGDGNMVWVINLQHGSIRMVASMVHNRLPTPRWKHAWRAKQCVAKTRAASHWHAHGRLSLSGSRFRRIVTLSVRCSSPRKTRRQSNGHGFTCDSRSDISTDKQSQFDSNTRAFAAVVDLATSSSCCQAYYSGRLAEAARFTALILWYVYIDVRMRAGVTAE